MTFSTLGLSAELLRAVGEQGYDTPTPIQAQAIPAILAGADLMASAQTGTGKTAAFTLPLLQRLGAGPRANGRPRALVLVPTRELAAQVADSVRTYGRHLRLRCAQIFGGVNIAPQVRELRSGVDIIVATPGRLLDHLERRSVDLSEVEVLVLDEADRMLDMGFLPAIERIVKQLPRTRQTLLFSATFAEAIRALAQRFLRSPTTIDIARRNAVAEAVSHQAYRVDHARKRELLTHLFEERSWQQVLVFTRTKHGAERLAKQLHKAGIDASAIHGDKNQNQRMRALAAFKRMEVRALVATDVAARGLDIDELPHVVNFDLPHNPEDYVHRIGRTGRAGQSGEAVSLVAAEEHAQFAAIKRLIKVEVPIAVVEGFAPHTQGARELAREQVRQRPPQRNPRQAVPDREARSSRSGSSHRHDRHDHRDQRSSRYESGSQTHRSNGRPQKNRRPTRENAVIG
ncbi:MAG: DEAD/DEAH box helicase [Sulfurifustaceae bacterium]